jgi:hypothetical protein
VIRRRRKVPKSTVGFRRRRALRKVCAEDMTVEDMEAVMADLRKRIEVLEREDH